MSASGKKREKKKYKRVAVDQVMPNLLVRPNASWAEQVESERLNDNFSLKKINSISLPTAPRAACDLVIDDTKIPPNGPFMAYLSNLPYEITEDDIASQFKELKVVNIQLPKDDRQDRMKGFGYVEFKDKSNLLAALQEGELTLKGRTVRVSLPADEEQRQERGSRSGGMSFGRNRDMDRSDRSEKTFGDWRAGAPVPHDPEKSTTSKHSGVGFTRPNNRDRDRESGPFREYRSGGYQSNDSGGSFSRAFRDRDDRDGGRPSERSGGRPFKRFESYEDRGPRSAFGRKFDRDDRDSDFVREPEKEEPKERPKLNLVPRSVTADEVNNEPQALPASIFGSAKPVDTKKREMEMEAKINMMNSTVRNPSPRLTPTSNLSRASSVSSISSSRKRDGDQSENYGKSSGQLEYEENDTNDGGKAPENVWAQRSAANAATSAPANDDENNESSNDNEENAENVRAAEESSSKYVPPRPSVNTNQVSEDQSDRYTAPRSEKSELNESEKSFNTPQYSEGGGSHRFGNRYNDNKFSSNFNRENRRDRGKRDNYRDNDRRSDRFSHKRDNDDNYSGGGNRGNDSNSFSSKWNQNFREGGSFRNNRSSDFGGSRRHDRDNGGGVFRDRNENRSNAYRSFGSREHDRGENRNGRYDDRRHYDERLNEGEENERDSTKTAADMQQQHELADSRLRGSPEDNGGSFENGQENGLKEGDDGTRDSSENLTNSADVENDNAFKTHKKSKKKKNVEYEDTVNERDARLPDGERKLRNQKEEKKSMDNHHSNNDKASNKNNIKAKDNRNERSVKKPREPRDELPKQKEEKTPNFQDTNRFQFLKPEE